MDKQGLKLWLLLLSSFCVSLPAFSQPYTWSLGMKIGEPSAIDAKFFRTELIAFEFIAGKRVFDSPQNKDKTEKLIVHYILGATMAFHKYDILNIPDLMLYGGPGLQMGVTGEYSLAAAGVIGMEYVFSGVPLTIFWDFLPAFQIIPENRFFPGGGFGIRYILL